MQAEWRPVDIWTVSLETPRQIVLAHDEQERAARFRFERDRVHWARARTAVRAILARYLDCEPLGLQFSYGDHGKPAVVNGRGLNFNVSHSGEWGMVAITWQVDVGVDLERVRENVDIGKLLARLGETELPHTRPELYQRWARREAASKAVGGPLMRKVDPRVCTADLDAPERYAAAVAMVGFRPGPEYRGSI